MKAGRAVLALENALCRDLQTPVGARPMPSDVQDATNIKRPRIFNTQKAATHGSLLPRFVPILSTPKCELGITVALPRTWGPTGWHG